MTPIFMAELSYTAPAASGYGDARRRIKRRSVRFDRNGMLSGFGMTANSTAGLDDETMLPTLDDIRQARDAIRGSALRTPLVRLNFSMHRRRST